jgi:cytochrome c biogenesis protein CcdA
MTYETTRAYAMQLLMLYNLIFVLPMIGVVLAVYLGLATTAETAHWRHKRVGLLHLIIGAIMFYMGIWMLFFY